MAKIFRADGVTHIGKLLVLVAVVAILCGGLGGPEEGVYGTIYGFLGHSGKGDCVHCGVKGGLGVGVVERTTRSG